MRALFAALVLSSAVPAFAQSGDVHAGLRCETSAECGELRCVEERCIDPQHPPPRVRDVRADAPGTHAFVGLVALAGPALGGVLESRWDSSVQPTGLVALRAGLLVGRHEIALELSPFSYSYYQPEPGPTFQANVTYGYRVPLVRTESLSVAWPLRVGAGFFAGNVGGDVYFQARADLVGVSFAVGPVVIDVYAPSFRYAVSSVFGRTPNLLSWEFGVGTSYVF